MALEGAIQSSVSSWLGQGRLSTTLAPEGNLSRLRAYSVFRMGIEGGLSFRKILVNLVLEEARTGLKHTYWRRDMQRDWAIIRDNVDVQGSMLDKPPSYMPKLWDTGIGNPSMSREYLHVVDFQMRDQFTGAVRTVSASYANDDLMSMEELYPYIDWDRYQLQLGANEVLEDVRLNAVYKRM